MTDDFHLFGDPDDGTRQIDPDLALMSAYLARELSPMQVLAVEERLATDAAFRAAMQPLLDAWAAPVPSLQKGASRGEAALSELERDASWHRFQREASPATGLRQVSHRRMTMKRAAAVIALVVVPMASFAQVVMYAASNPDARGHVIAKRIVAPFARATSAPKPGVQLRGATQASPNVPRAREVDTGALLPVPTAPVFELESESSAARTSRAAVNAVSGMRALPVPSGVSNAPAQIRQPNRARIAELARQHQPAVIGGDTGADYLVMVLDAAEQYVWSTFGSGNVMIEVAGDTRTAAERDAYLRTYRAEFWGDTLGPTGLRAVATGIAVGSGDVATRMAIGAARGGGRGGVAVRAIRDSASAGAAGDTAGRYAIGTAQGTATGRLIRIDSLRDRRRRLEVAGAAIGQGRSGVDTARAMSGSGVAVTGGAARGGGSGVRIVEAYGTITSAARPNIYRHGFRSSRNGPEVNQAPGLVNIDDEWSGIEGLPSAFVAGAETYSFPAGALAPTPLRVIVVRLTPDAVWTPR